jgi:hypothetical protein
MNARRSGIVLQRAVLQRRCAAQREQLTAAINAVESRLHGIDRATLAVRKLRLAPVLLVVIATAVVATPLLRTISRGVTIASALGQLLRSRWLGSAVRSIRDSTRSQELPQSSSDGGS